jgi:hypothetical protein
MKRTLCSIALALLSACNDGATEREGDRRGDDRAPTPEHNAEAGFHPGNPHTPATGCHEGYAECGDVCADLSSDGRHCGGCGIACSSFAGCVDGVCVEGDAGCGHSYARCDGACVFPNTDADHCGSCNNRCADDALCIDGLCLDGGGFGASCDDPAYFDSSHEENAGFHLSEALSTPHTFACGPPEPLATRWFRVTIGDDLNNVEVRGHASDDYMIEIFSDDSCDTDALVACNDNYNGDPDPRIDHPATTPDLPFWVAVGVKGSWSGKAAVFRVDH